ncbi:MAG: hypothetical protein WC813_00885 [Patescibacteria group bacterium]|jgi:hypothetical protein
MNRILFLAVLAFTALTGCQMHPDAPNGNQSGGGNNDQGDDIIQQEPALVEIIATQEDIDGTNVSLYAKGEGNDNVNWIANPNAVPIDTDSDGRGEIGNWTQFEVACGEEITLQCNFRDRQGRERWCFENDPDDGGTNQFLADDVWVDGVVSRLRPVFNEWTGANDSHGYNAVITRNCR